MLFVAHIYAFSFPELLEVFPYIAFWHLRAVSYVIFVYDSRKKKDIYDKRIASRIYRAPLKLKTVKINNPI